jgi:hypothetical protein
MMRGVRTPPQARLHPIALIEDEESIQASLMEVINALMRNTIDLKRATLILRALHIAVKNAHRVKFNAGREAIREVPNYAGQTAPLSEQAAIHEAMNIPRYDPNGPTPPRIRTAAELATERNLHRPTDAEAHAAAKNHVETTTAHVGTAAPEVRSAVASSPQNSPGKKPPTRVTQPAAEERKTAAQRASAG